MQTAKSRSGYGYVVNRITAELGNVELRRLTVGRVTKFYKGLLERYSYRTADQTLSMLSMILGAAVDEHLIAENVAKKVNRRSARLAGVETEVVIPTPDEVAAIMTATPDRWGAFVALGFGAGLRFGEVRGVTLDRLDLNRSTLAVDRQLVQEEGKGLYFDQTKNGVKRPVDLPTHVRDALARHIEQWPSDDPHGLIFQGPRGGHIYRSTWWSVWDCIRTDAKRPETRFHDLRHYYASSLLSNGASVPAVADAIGDTAEEVMRTYAHVMPQDRGIVRAASEPRGREGARRHARNGADRDRRRGLRDSAVTHELPMGTPTVVGHRQPPTVTARSVRRTSTGIPSSPDNHRQPPTVSDHGSGLFPAYRPTHQHPALFAGVRRSCGGPVTHG